jgi:hypothetical protein
MSTAKPRRLAVGPAGAAQCRSLPGLMRNRSRPGTTPAGDERGSISTLPSLSEITSAERAVADLLPIGVDPEDTRRVLARVPLWVDTFALNAERGPRAIAVVQPP